MVKKGKTVKMKFKDNVWFNLLELKDILKVNSR